MNPLVVEDKLARAEHAERLAEHFARARAALNKPERRNEV